MEENNVIWYLVEEKNHKRKKRRNAPRRGRRKTWRKRQLRRTWLLEEIDWSVEVSVRWSESEKCQKKRSASLYLFVFLKLFFENVWNTCRLPAQLALKKTAGLVVPANLDEKFSIKNHKKSHQLFFEMSRGSQHWPRVRANVSTPASVLWRMQARMRCNTEPAG